MAYRKQVWRGLALSPPSVITCENGHEICDLVQPLAPGCRDVDMLGNFRGRKPQPGTPYEDCACPECGAKWIRGRAYWKKGIRNEQHAFELHTDAGWV